MTETADLYNSGMSLHEIGRKLGISHVAVWSRLRKEGVELRSAGRPRKPVAEFALLLGEGASTSPGAMYERCKHRALKTVDWRALFPLSDEERRLVVECLDVDNLSFPDTIEVIEDYRNVDLGSRRHRS